MERRPYAVAGVAALLILGVPPATVGAATYAISSPSAVDVPDRTVSVGGTSLDVTEVARLSRGARLVLDTDAPSGVTYAVELRDSNKAFVAGAEGTGDDTVRFPTGSLSPGTYFAAIYDGGRVQAVLPVVVKGYAVDASVPDEAAAGTEFEVSVGLVEETRSPPPSTVEVTVAEEDTESVVARRTLSRDGPLTYAGTVAVEDAGDYSAQVFVRGHEEIDGEKVLLGLSDPVSLEVTAIEEIPAPTEPSGGGSSGVTPAETTTQMPSSMVTPTDTPTPTETETTTDDSTVAATRTSKEATGATPPSSTRALIDAVPLLVALLVIGGLVRWWRR
jgi:hypothetical protein